ncbi:hypothetical protein NQ317_006534 [Molorchus minor]|uniref:Uncharacterized protein n=1 Tax=Molorchus minor TaxID=1323400 RepID=A0ABQ9J927_9CUCU|nr:hypothetical protein NQ317_006534 [Molorchus minor]
MYIKIIALDNISIIFYGISMGRDPAAGMVDVKSMFPNVLQVPNKASGFSTYFTRRGMAVGIELNFIGKLLETNRNLLDTNSTEVALSCTMNNCESEEIVEAANIAISNLLPTKSRSLYDIAYNRFKKWCAEKNVQVYSENVLLAYFSENAKNYKSSTLWAQYSMSEIDRFLSSADDKEFLKIKVGLILGIAGACRTD